MPRIERAVAPVEASADPISTVDDSLIGIKKLQYMQYDEWRATVDQEQVWLLPELIPAKGLVIVSGQQKRAKKTWFVDELAICCATGTECSIIKPAAPFPVLYLAGEGTPAQRRSRMDGIAASLGVTGRIGNLFYSWPQGVALNDPEWRREVLATVRETGAQLVILDSLTFLQDGDENDKQSMHAVVRTLMAINRLGAAVILVMHLSGARGEMQDLDVDSQLRGSTIFANCYDTHLALRCYNSKAAWIDLTARHRGYQELDYKVVWKISGSFDGKITGVNFHAEKWTDIGDDAFAKTDINVITPGMKCRARDIGRLLGGSIAILKPAVDMMRASGTLMVEDGEWYVFTRQPTMDEMHACAALLATAAEEREQTAQSQSFGSTQHHRSRARSKTAKSATVDLI